MLGSVVAMAGVFPCLDRVDFFLILVEVQVDLVWCFLPLILRAHAAPYAHDYADHHPEGLKGPKCVRNDTIFNLETVISSLDSTSRAARTPKQT